MKITLNWLKDFIDVTVSPEELSDTLTMIGLEVEEFYQLPRHFSNVKIGQVVEVKKHPEADLLTLCKVDVGHKLLTVLCGAPNVKKGIFVPIALEGALVANGIQVKNRKIRGIMSEGMLCSEAELGLTERSEGLMILPDTCKAGENFSTYLGEPDTVFDISVTPNRPDCLSIIGIARQYSAFSGNPLKIPQINLPVEKAPTEKSVTVDIKDPDLCYRYSGRLLENIYIKESPFWLAARLHAVGIRSISNVVDITNYIMMETGHPLHAFDHRFIEGSQIIIRNAQKGELFKTLDGQEHDLNDEALLICDQNKAIALAGIMGGLNSEVQNDTKTVFLESAYFAPTNIRRTSKKLGLSTESSRRFERGADPNGTLYARDRAAQLLCELADATLSSNVVDSYPHQVTPAKVELSLEKSNKLLGMTLSEEETVKILGSLHCEHVSSSSGNLIFSIPTFRPDLTREVDLIEEIAILYGYNDIPVETSPPIDQLQMINDQIVLQDNIRHFLAGLGYRETINLSLVSPQSGRDFLQGGSEFVELLNPLSPDMSVFRPNLLLSLLTSVAYNRNRQLNNLRFFEIGNVAWQNGDNSISEFTQVAGVLAGKRYEENWYQKPEQFDFFDIKGAVIGVLRKFGISSFQQVKVREKYWDYENSGIEVDGHYLGSYGKISNKICSSFKLKTSDIYGFYLDVDLIAKYWSKYNVYNSVPRYPAIHFDLALVADANIPVGRIEQEIKDAAGPYLQKMHLFDFYKGDRIQKGKKSIAFSLTFNSKERTLKDKEVELSIENILSSLKEKLNAQLRPA